MAVGGVNVQMVVTQSQELAIVGIARKANLFGSAQERKQDGIQVNFEANR